MLTSIPEPTESAHDGSVRVAVHVAAIAVLVLATVLAFTPTFRNGFVAWDDDFNLYKNAAYRGLGPTQLYWMFTSSHHGHYHPLTWITFGLDYVIWGMEEFGYHLTSLILHVLGAAACYAMALSILRLALTPAVAPGTLAFGALITASIFAIHPLRAESVAWATERRDVLSGLFYFLGVWTYLHAHSRGSARRRTWMIACFVLYVLALLSKVITVSLPAVLLVLDVFPLRRLEGGEARFRRAAMMIVEKLPLFGAGVGVSLLAVFAQTDVESMLSLREHWITSRLVQVPYSLWFYVYKTFVPVALSPLYELPKTLPLTNPRFLWPVVFVAVVTIGLVRVRRRWPALLAAWTAHALMIVPVSGLFQNGPQITADRYSYLSCMPYALLVGGAVAVVVGRAASGVIRAGVTVCAIAGLVALAFLTFRQTGFWRDSITLWSRVVEVEPHNAFGNNNRGVHLMAEGKYDLAEVHYRRSLKTEPRYARALCNLGILYVLRGNTGEAIRYFREAIAADPRYAPARHQLGSVWYKMGDNVAARASFLTALELDPGDPRVYTNLAVAENALHDPTTAVDTLRRGLKIAPDDLHLNRMLAWLLATALDDRLRNGVEAVRRAELANRLSNGADFHCLLTLSAAYAEAGRFDEAIRVAEEALAVAVRGGQADQTRSAEQLAAMFRARRPYRE